MCLSCDEDIPVGSVYVHGAALGEDAVWHPTCFTCHQCKEILANLVYCFKEGHIFCPRHHAEQIKPRCCMCDEVFCTILLSLVIQHTRGPFWRNFEIFTIRRSIEGLGPNYVLFTKKMCIFVGQIGSKSLWSKLSKAIVNCKICQILNVIERFQVQLMIEITRKFKAKKLQHFCVRFNSPDLSLITHDW